MNLLTPAFPAVKMSTFQVSVEEVDWDLTPEELFTRYLEVLEFLRENPWGFQILKLTSKSGSRLVGTFCRTCTSPLGTDNFCGHCRKFDFNSREIEGPLFGLLNPPSSYPVPENILKEGVRSVAAYLAAEEEVARLQPTLKEAHHGR